MRDHDHDHDQYRCPICGAKFDSKPDLNDHDRRLHTQQGISGIAPSNVYPESGEAKEKDDQKDEQKDEQRSRKDREFNRSNWE